MPRGDGELTIREARIFGRNFAGKEGPYNAEGDRNFCLVLPRDLADQMERDGWNVKVLSARDEDEGAVGEPFVQVRVNYSPKSRPPHVVLVTHQGRRKTELDEDTVDTLDWVDIQRLDLTIRPYTWQVKGKGGIKAYLKTMYVTIREDPLDLEYADLEDLPARGGRVEE